MSEPPVCSFPVPLHRYTISIGKIVSRK